MALGFRTGGMFGRQPLAMPAQGAMPIGVEQMQQKPGFFQRPGVKTAAGILGDTLLTLGGGQPMFGPMMHDRRMQEEDARLRQQLVQQQRMQKREDMQWEWQNKPKDGPQLTEYERIVRASGLPEAEQLKLLQDYARNRANPVQGVPFTDEQGNSGIQFIRPGQMQGAQQGLIPIGGTLPPKGGSGGNVTGGFR